MKKRLAWGRLLPRILLAILFGGSTSTSIAGSRQTLSFDACISKELQQGNWPENASAIKAAYERNELALLWRDSDRASRRAHEISEVLRSTAEYGLPPSDYDPPTRAARLQRSCPQANADAIYDVALSIEILRFVSHVHAGRVNPIAADFHIPPSREPLDAYEVLQQLATSADVHEAIARYEPDSPYYRRLKAALQQYRVLAANSSLTHLPPLPQRSIGLGDTYQGAVQLRALLQATSDLATPVAAADTTGLDEATLDAVARFQKRHGLAADGKLGPLTYASLTTPMARRLRQIELTLERWRWLPALQPPILIINIPQFVVFALPRADDPEGEILEMPVIVGKPWLRTPVFVDEIEAVVFRPFWNVPPSIVRSELLPLIRRNPGYLDKHQFEIVRGQGDDATRVDPTPDHLDALAKGKLRLRQRPGADNALGLLKFELPNTYNVYLHDTPAAALFQRPSRAFSHGCIRVSNPALLAQYVLKDTPGNWDSAAIEAAMCGTRTIRVQLQKRVPVMVLYGTVLARQDGSTMFFDDIYGYDRRLEELLTRSARRMAVDDQDSLSHTAAHAGG